MGPALGAPVGCFARAGRPPKVRPKVCESSGWQMVLWAGCVAEIFASLPATESQACQPTRGNFGISRAIQICSTMEDDRLMAAAAAMADMSGVGASTAGNAGDGEAAEIAAAMQIAEDQATGADWSSQQEYGGAADNPRVGNDDEDPTDEINPRQNKRRRGPSLAEEESAEGAVAEPPAESGDDIPANLKVICHTNPTFFSTFMETIYEYHISKGKLLDEYAARDLGRKDAGDRYLEQMSAVADGRKTTQPYGVKKHDGSGNRIARKKSTRLRGDGKTKHVVEALHEIDASFFTGRGRTIPILLGELRDALCSHRATVLPEEYTTPQESTDPDEPATCFKDRPITGDDNIWTILQPFVESNPTVGRREIVFIKETLLDDYIWRYVLGGRKGLIAGLLRVVRCDLLNKDCAMKVGSCHQDGSWTRIDSDGATYPRALFDVDRAWAVLEITAPLLGLGLARTRDAIAEEELDRAVHVAEGVIFDLLKFVLHKGAGMNRPACSDLGNLIKSLKSGSDTLRTNVVGGQYSKSIKKVAYIVNTKDRLEDYIRLSNRGIQYEASSLREYAKIVTHVGAIIEANDSNADLPRLKRGETLGDAIKFSHRQVLSARMFLAQQKCIWSSSNLHPVKAEILRKNNSIRSYLGESGGPRPSDDELWEQMYVEFKRIQQTRHPTTPPDAYGGEDYIGYDVLNDWLFKQLLATSRRTIQEEREKKLIAVYPNWYKIAKDRIRNNVVAAPRCRRQVRTEDRCVCGECGEMHEWEDVVPMICSGCNKWYDNRPECIDMSPEDAIDLMKRPVGQNIWRCSECPEQEG